MKIGPGKLNRSSPGPSAQGKALGAKTAKISKWSAYTNLLRLWEDLENVSEPGCFKWWFVRSWKLLVHALLQLKLHESTKLLKFASRALELFLLTTCGDAHLYSCLRNCFFASFSTPPNSSPFGIQPNIFMIILLSLKFPASLVWAFAASPLIVCGQLYSIGFHALQFNLIEEF